MHRLSIRFLPLILLLLVPGIAQMEEGSTTFTLSTDRTFGLGEKARVRLWGRGFQKLQFRLYKVKDVEKFFRNLDDPNQFGGQSHRPVRALTTLEKYHRWKAGSRAAFRNVFRRQFPQDSREVIRASLVRSQEAQRLASRKAGPSAVTEYADIPVLNQQQLVATWEQPFQVARDWESAQVDVDTKERGVYLVEATDGKLQAYTIVCVTDLVMLTKTSSSGILARVVDRKSGQPVVDAEIAGWSNHQEVLRTKPDTTGLADLRPKLGKTQEGLDRNLMLLAIRGNDYAPLPVGEWQLRQSAGDPTLTAYVYTDRPVYRPGHQMRFKAVLRQVRPLGFDLPLAAPVEVTVEDPEGKEVLKRSLLPNSVGSVKGELTLSETTALGYYSVSVRSGENYAGNTGFHVEEYRKPEYEVRVTPGSVRVLQGETVRATIQARYYFGEPVPGAKVKYVVHRSRYWPPWYDQDEEDESSSTDAQDEYLANEQMLEQEGKLDANGMLNVEFASEKTGYDLRYRIEARVTDEANREVSGTGWITATRARFYVRVDPDRYVYDSGQQANLKVETKDYDGKAVPDIAFEAKLKKKGNVIATTSGRTDANGLGTASLPVTSGSLEAQVIAKDVDGRTTESTSHLWVSGVSGLYADWGQQQRIEIISDKKSYKAGERARLLIVTGVPAASIWLTAESSGVIFSKVVNAKGPTATLEVPIEDSYAPNIYVSATVVRDGQLYSGLKSLKVPPVAQKLDVSVKASKSQFQPGEKGTYTIEAKDAAGRPADTEVSLGVVDEAIYAIRRESVQDITQFFYGRRFSGVQTTTSLHYMFSGSSGKRRMELAMSFSKPRLAQLKPEKFVDPRVRKAFPDTLYWLADVRTGASGRAVVPVEFPDALTTWRATARGITADTRVGSAVDKTIVRKNVILRLTTPRFFMQGDEVTIAAIVQNYLASDKTVRVSLEAKGLELIDGGTRDVTVPSRGVQQVLYKVRANAPGSAVLLGKALTDEESDALELTVPVNPYGVKLSESRTGLLDSGTTAETELRFPDDSNPASRMVEITVSPSVAGTMFSALDYLLTFPYGCTEQTMSSFLPNVIVSQATKVLGIKAGVNEAEALRKTRAGLERLYSYQHEDGGWGWWQTDDSSVFMTAYVVSGLAQARAAGYTLKSNSLESAATWLKTELPKTKEKPAQDLLAYVAYALSLAGQPHAPLLDSVWSQRSELSASGAALLGLALGDSAKKQELAQRLAREARSTDREAWWEVKTDTLLGIDVATTPEATAFVLKFLVSQAPDSDLLPKAALYLMTHRDQGYYWSSTKQTAMVIFGLTDYLKASKELQPDYTATVTLNGQNLGSRQITTPEPWTIRVPGNGLEKVVVTKSAAGRLYWSAQSTYYSTAEKLTSSGSSAPAISREYFRLQPDKQGDKVVHRLIPLEGALAKGDVVAVRLKLRGNGGQYLLTEDPIPSGSEFVSRDDLYDLAEKPDWWSRWSARRELHDDRMALFQRWMLKEGSDQTYLLKITNSGKFRVPPARVSPMYQPGIFATSESRVLEVQ
ncbi:MAG: alpha-2-macroglobulin [Bryobacteraceae bacterium]|nr:alpha-2-macroglobulin [Bryobacteraceae bacterium]